MASTILSLDKEQHQFILFPAATRPHLFYGMEGSQLGEWPVYTASLIQRDRVTVLPVTLAATVPLPGFGEPQQWFRTALVDPATGKPNGIRHVITGANGTKLVLMCRIEHSAAYDGPTVPEDDIDMSDWSVPLLRPHEMMAEDDQDLDDMDDDDRAQRDD